MTRGMVKFFDAVRGFGFIEGDGGDDTFVHVSAVKAAGLPGLWTGDVVDYLVEQGRDGRTRATDLKLVESSPRTIRTAGGRHA